jgi:hypothetical protein
LIIGGYKLACILLIGEEKSFIKLAQGVTFFILNFKKSDINFPTFWDTVGRGANPEMIRLKLRHLQGSAKTLNKEPLLKGKALYS